MTQHTSLSVGEESEKHRTHKLRKFGSAVIHRPVSEAIAQADADDLFAQSHWEKLS